jgi:outer membrane lipoprotein SlyB
MQAGGGRLAALGALGGAVAGGLGGAGAGAVLGGGAGGLAGQLGGAALGGYAGERLMNPRPRRKKKSVSVGKGKSKLEITVKKASEVSDSALIAAAQVLEMRKSAHVNLRIPEYVLGY